MAEKVLGFRIDIKGTEQETAQMSKLTAETNKMRQAIRVLNQVEKANGTLTAKQAKTRTLLNTQIKANTANYNKLNRAVLQNNNVTKKNESFTKKLGRSFVQVGAAMIGVGVAIGAVTRVIGGAIKTMIEFEKANSQLEAVLGANGDEMKALKKDALDLGSTTKFTATEVTGLQIEFAKLGFPTDKILDMTSATLNGAAALGSDLSEQAAFTGAVLRQFSLDADEAARLNDVMAKAASSTALDFGKLSTALPIVGATAATAGVSLERTTALLGSLANRGLDASTSGTALRNVFLELSKQGLTFDEAMAKVNTSTDKNKTAMELFGKRGATVGVILAETGATVDELTGNLEDSRGAAQEMADTMLDNLAGDITKAESAYEGFTLALLEGDSVISDSLREITKLSASYLNLFTNLLNGEDAFKSFAKAGTESMIAMGTLSEENIDGMSISMADLTKVAAENEAVFKVLNDRLASGKITQEEFEVAIRNLANGYKLLNEEERQNAIIAKKRANQDAAEASRNEQLQADIDAGIEADKAASQAEDKRFKEQEKANKKSQAEAKKHADELEKIRRSNEEKALKELLSLNRIHFEDKRKEALNQLDIEFEEKIEKVTGDSQVEQDLRLALEDQLRAAKKVKQAEFDEEDAEKALEERELELENRLVLAEEDLELQRQILEQQRALELEQKNLTEAEKDSINIKFNQKKKDLDQIEADNKKRLLEGDLQAAAGLASALSGLAEEGSAEAKAFATAAALINTYLAISGALANGAKLGPFAVAAQVATASAIGFAQVASINSTQFSEGGIVEGASHEQGGIQMYHKGGSHLGEMEGNEYIISAKRTREIGVDALDAMNFGGSAPALNGFFANGGSVPSSSGSGAVRQVVNEQTTQEQFAETVSVLMQDAIIRTPVVNNAVETLGVAAEVQQTETELSFG